jgi:hypothetical protein
VRATLAVSVLLAASVSSAWAASAPRTTKAPWSRPNDTLALARSAGLKPERHEFFQFHVHAHLDIFVARKRVRIPGGIGIDITDPGVQRGRSADGTWGFGGIRECEHPCIAPLHTHSDDGILHTESQRHHPNQLGEFFTEWRVRLSRTCIGGYCRGVRFYVGGKRFGGDPRTIALTNLKEIAIVVGKPPARIPSAFP